MSLIPVYRGSDGDEAPEKLFCEQFGYPHKTTTGEVMYENTHFRTEDEAWASILQSAMAQNDNCRSAVESAEQVLVKARGRWSTALGRLGRVLAHMPAKSLEISRRKP